MIKWFFVGLLLSILMSVLFITFVGVAPRPQKVINPSRFENLEHMGFSVYQRLNQDINKGQIIILGDSQYIQEAHKIWRGLLLAQRKYRPQKQILIEYQLDSASSGKLGSDRVVIDSQDELLKVTKSELALGNQVVIHTRNENSHHLYEGNLTEIFIKALKVLPLTFSQGLFAVSKDKLKDWPPCLLEDPSTSLICKSIEVSHKYFRKNYSSIELRGVLERHGANSFLVFVSEPK